MLLREISFPVGVVMLFLLLFDLYVCPYSVKTAPNTTFSVKNALLKSNI